MNQFMLVGRVKELPEMTKTSKGIVVGKMVVEAERNFLHSFGGICSRRTEARHDLLD